MHSEKVLIFKIEVIRKDLDSPGLRIFNFHPLNLTLNTPTTEHDLKHKFLYKKRDAEWHKCVFEGLGEHNFLEDLVFYFKKR